MRTAGTIGRCSALMSRVALALAFAYGTASAAQPATENVEVDPVTCWWRTDTGSVRVGQPFSLTLTCSILETDAAKAIVERSRLAPAALQLPPFEVIGGTQGPDLTTAGRRFIQYEYSLRLISDAVFGGDTPIPSLPITYRVESRVQQGGSVQGRDQTYLLPPLSMHVASLVPADATHIRESPVPSLSAIAARESRGTLLRSTAVVVVILGALLGVVSVVRALHQRRKAAAAAAERLVSHGAVLRGVRRELEAIRQEVAREGWSHALIARALAALRVTAAYAANQPVAQRRATVRDRAVGEIALRAGLTGRRIAVSGSSTPAVLASVANGIAMDLRSALEQFTGARYGRTGAIDSPRLDDALDAGIRATNRVAARHTWVAELSGALRRSVNDFRERAWAR